MNGESQLTVLMGGMRCGVIRRDRHGALTLVYDADYMAKPEATPLSLSLPFRTRPYRDRAAQRWIASLLPDNPATLADWYGRSNTSTPFGLLGTTAGHDCAGAVQFCRPGEEEALAARASGITMLSDEQVAAEVERMVANPSRWIDEDIEPYFSLGGYQTKIALQRVGDRWGRPYGSVPTTHILKPRHADSGSVAVVEHLCAAAARRVGLSATITGLEVHAGHPVLVAERYDRTLTERGWVRRHQEDMCQALGLDGGQKYERDGGPGISAIGDVIRNYSSDPGGDIQRFADGILWALILVNRDAHARNYSLLLTGAEARLAPLYDLHSSLPYVAHGIGRRDMAMRYGSDFTVYGAGSDHALLDVAARLMLSPQWLLARAEAFTTSLRAAVAQEVEALPTELQSLNHIEKFDKRLQRRALDLERTINGNRRRLSTTSETTSNRSVEFGT